VTPAPIIERDTERGERERCVREVRERKQVTSHWKRALPPPFLARREREREREREARERDERLRALGKRERKRGLKPLLLAAESVV
jgi:hypothetical protein